MNGNSHPVKRAITGLALAAAVAALVASSALASGGNSSSVSYTGASTTQTDGYGAVLERHFQHEDSLDPKTASTLSQCPCDSGLPVAAASTGTFAASSQTGPSSLCPCNSGLVGGPRVSIPLAGSSTSVIHPRGGFDWNDAGMGVGAALGLALIALAVGTLGARARKDSKMTVDWNIKKRRRLARALERAAVPERPFIGRGPRYLVQPSVTAACAPSLQAIATALRDETLALDEHELHAVQAFITDSGSPFLGRDTTEALREAVRLQHIVVQAETAVLDEERVAAAA